MRWWIGAVGTVLVSLFSVSSVYAASTTITISELQTGSASSASQEFIELYNQTSQDLSLAGWTISYKSAAGSSWASKVTLSGVIPANGFYLLGASGYAIGADQTFASGLSGTGGHIRLVDSLGAVVDLLGWGTAAGAEGSQAAAAPAGGQSIERLPGRLNATGGNGVDGDNNATDFIVRLSPEAQSTLAASEVPDLSITFEPTVDEVAPDAAEYLPVMITELLPDPASPKTDAAHEFIELYNPNDQDVNVAGYTLRTGIGYKDFYILPSLVIPSHGYAVYYSGSTRLGLTNSGGTVQLLDPAGAIVSQTSAYSAAKSEQVWGYFDGVWKWTLAPTPGSENVYEQVVIATKAVAKAPSTPKATVKKKAPKSTVKKTTAAKSSSKKTPAPKASFANTSNVLPRTSTGAWLIIGLATLTIGYAVYEYRTDLQNRIYLGRRKLKAWRANRKRP